MKKYILASLLTSSSALFAHGFIEGTLINTDKYHISEIQNISFGQNVLACNGTRCTIRGVTHASTEMGINKLIKLTNSLGDSVTCSDSQQFFTKRGWVSAKDIKSNDLVFNSEHGFVEIESIESMDKQLSTYAFSVARDHDFFANGFLSHNWGDNNGGDGGKGGDCSGKSCTRGGDGGSGGNGGSSNDGGSGSGNGNGNGSGNGNGNGNGGK